MCFPTNSTPGTDGYLGHGLMARAFTGYISLAPALHGCYSRGATLTQEPLDFYIARVIHACCIPEIVPYIALYILTYTTQPCQCRRPHAEREHACSSPSKVSHILSRAVTRTPFSRICQSHWTAAHAFMGAFTLALETYKATFPEEDDDFCCWRILPEVAGFSRRELDDLTTAFKQCLTCELRLAIDTMKFSREMRPVAEVDCPFALARRQRLSKQKEEKDSHGGPKRKLSLTGSPGPLFKPREKGTDSMESEE